MANESGTYHNSLRGMLRNYNIHIQYITKIPKILKYSLKIMVKLHQFEEYKCALSISDKQSTANYLMIVKEKFITIGEKTTTTFI